jgi:hypothetical protein
VSRLVVADTAALFSVILKAAVPAAAKHCDSASFSVHFNSLRPPDQVVNQRANPVGKNDNQNPNQFVVSFGGFIRGAIDDHPNPKKRRRNADQKNETEK